MSIRSFVLIACLASVSAVAQSSPELTWRNYDKWRKHVLPGQKELAWLEISWRAALRDAVVEADRLDKPVLLWAMNGHPLGCT